MSWTSDDSRMVRSALSELTFRLSTAIDENFTSPNELDRNSEHANVVDGLFAIARAIGEHSAQDNEPSNDVFTKAEYTYFLELMDNAAHMGGSYVIWRGQSVNVDSIRARLEAICGKIEDKE
jgi:hypothetical protein